MLYQALRRGESIGLLPDHAPGIGEGVWADFFGKPAFTMTLPRRLQFPAENDVEIGRVSPPKDDTSYNSSCGSICVVCIAVTHMEQPTSCLSFPDSRFQLHVFVWTGVGKQWNQSQARDAHAWP